MTTTAWRHRSGHAPSVAAAVARVQAAAGRNNVAISLHLAHEFKAGNQHRLTEVIQAVVDGVTIATINGTDSEVSSVPNDWSRTILPLGDGDFDVKTRYLDVLLATGYDGPIALQTFAIREPPERHFARSASVWREWTR